MLRISYILSSQNWTNCIWQIQFKSRFRKKSKHFDHRSDNQERMCFLWSGGGFCLTPGWVKHKGNVWILTSDDGMSLDSPDRWWQGIPPRMGPKSVKFGGITVGESPEIWSCNYGFWNYFTPSLMIFFSKFPPRWKEDNKGKVFLYFVIFFSRKMISRHFSC